MDDKKLDINQPLLTVRRSSSTPNSNKDDNPSLPRLPLLPPHHSELKPGPVRNPGRVPFLWEESPGRPKNESISQSQTHKKVSTIPKLPPGKTVKAKQKGKCHEKFPSISECASSLERDSEELEEGGEAYVDAVDRLSRTGSAFLSSNLSGFDGLESKPSSTFSVDPQTRDFMMGRFLPAAKDLASEKPQYVSRKLPLKVVNVEIGDRKPPVRRLKANISPNYAEYQEEDEIEDEDDEPGHVSGRICGLLPRSCLLNPVPGMSLSASYVRKSRARSSSSSSWEDMKKELKRPATLEQRSASRLGPVPQLKKSSSLKSEFCNSAREAQTDEFGCLISLERSSNSYRKYLASQNGVIGSPRPVLEKTRYLTSSKLKSVSDGVVKVNKSEEIPSLYPLTKCNEVSNIVDESVVASESYSGELGESVGMKLLKDCEEDEDVEDQKQLTKVENVKSLQEMDVKFPFPPPLLKSPSESWLWRTLPSLSSRSYSSCSYLGTKVNYRYQASRYASR